MNQAAPHIQSRQDRASASVPRAITLEWIRWLRFIATSSKRNAFHDQGIAIIDLTDSRIPWKDREIIEGACQRLYGQKRAR